jgi:phenolic acid decarboxylase
MKINQEQIKEVENKFDSLGFFVKITEDESNFIVTFDNNIIFNVRKDLLEQSRIIQKDNLYNAFLASVLAKLLWHSDEVVRLPEDNEYSIKYAEKMIEMIKNEK